MGLFDHKNPQVSHLKDNKTCRFDNGFRCLLLLSGKTQKSINILPEAL